MKKAGARKKGVTIKYEKRNVDNVEGGEQTKAEKPLEDSAAPPATEEGQKEGMEKETVTEEAPAKPPVYVEDFAASFNDCSIDLAFPEHPEYGSSTPCYPKSYFTLSGKERLILLFAENFRRQFISAYPGRRPLLLAPKNKCGVQKFVCSTIRPTSFLFPPLIADLEGCASFVADFIEYKPLVKPGLLPYELVSPATLIRRRQGNSFEMATLLCSMLIGAGFPACVVSGSARLETINNDQRAVEYTLPKDLDLTDDQEEKHVSITAGNDKYKLKPKPDLQSHLDEDLERMRLERAQQEKFAQEEAERIERETREEEESFNDPNRLSHAWVVIIHNAPFSIKPRVKTLDEDGDEIDVPPTATFIEPSTGFQHETDSKAYIHIESVWNNHNYYVNMQDCRIKEMEWDLRDTSRWEHLLAGEPPEMRIAEQVSDENLTEEIHKSSVEKHSDVGRSWVEKLKITDKEFDQRFPKLKKTVYYHKVLHERYSNYSQPDGKVMHVTLFSDDNYQKPKIKWDWYENREDLLTNVKYVVKTGQMEESFQKGRKDSLRYFIHNEKTDQTKFLYFYSAPRLDEMKLCEVDDTQIVVHFVKAPGRCYYRKYQLKYGTGSSKKLINVIEKFERDKTKPANDDIAKRTFEISHNKILIHFHYNYGALTAVVREFTKPPRPDYGQEIIFDPNLAKGFRYDAFPKEPTQLELYLMLLAQLKAEEATKKSYALLNAELNSIFERRKREMEHTNLKINPYDPLRNGEARRLRLEKDEMENKIREERWASKPDFLAPYLVPYEGRALNHEESLKAYNACLNELKTRFVSLLNELQNRYEDLTVESQSLKKFLSKFQNKFDDFDYKRLIQESKDLELNKRMVQKRLTITHEEAQKKYDMVKQSLLKDKRLQLKHVVTLDLDPK